MEARILGLHSASPDIVVSSMLTVVGLLVCRVCRWIQLCLRAAGPGLGLGSGRGLELDTALGCGAAETRP